jgi:hypothetical protein
MTKRIIRIGPDSYELGDRSRAVLKSTAELLIFLELAHAWGVRQMPVEFIRRVFQFRSPLPVQSRLDGLVEQGAIVREHS